MKKSKLMIIISVFIAVLIIGGIWYYLTKHLKPLEYAENSAEKRLDHKQEPLPENTQEDLRLERERLERLERERERRRLSLEAERFKRESLERALELIESGVDRLQSESLEKTAPIPEYSENERFEMLLREVESLKREQTRLRKEVQQVTSEERALAESEAQESRTHAQLEKEDREARLTKAVDRILDAMESGAIAFNVPNEINIYDFPQIQLILSLAETEETLKRAVTEEGEKIGASIKVSHRMEARLTGYMFEITAITSEIQAVARGQRTEWRWEIHPKEAGTHKLHLTLTALLEIDSQSAPRVIRSFDRYIDVNVTPKQMLTIFFKKNWQWLWAAALVPLIGWLWRLKQKKQLTKGSS